ncbi:hypothetical protein X971_4755 [Agrobacterium tumefaciens LBA4213 (Ach5)]|nr:hypothetical protein X971_4755 [Agrobacterium tumefaciens LBA4213 (Ach5)]
MTWLKVSGGFVRGWLCETDADTTTVLVNEVEAGFFEGKTNRNERCSVP